MTPKSPIYTGGGDAGETSLFGGKRLSKASVRLHAYGTIDELNAAIGVVLASDTIPAPLSDQLRRVQSVLFLVGADLATPIDAATRIPRVEPDNVREVELWIDAWDDSLPELRTFILPGGSPDGAALHLARTIARRAERWIVELKADEGINPHVLTYVNRLGDYLFVAARSATKAHGGEETSVSVRQAFSDQTQN